MAQKNKIKNNDYKNTIVMKLCVFVCVCVCVCVPYVP